MQDRNNELRVFISSTFRDLQEEREHLVKKIFPEIRTLCRARGITFTEVDLRWGITADEQRDGRVIRTCLDEVARCSPYFIGILGSRHGWIPVASDVARDPALLDERPWIADALREGWSLTAMEHAERLRDASALGSAPVFRRCGDDVAYVEPGVEQLAARCSAWGCNVQDFDSPESLGSLVRAYLISIIEAFDRSAAQPTPLELERRAHATFAASRIHGYVERPELVASFEEWMRDGTTPIVVTGASGLGKSSLIASLASSIRSHASHACVIEHYTGASDSSASVDGMIRHLLEEIRDGFALDEPVPDVQQELEDALQSWLIRLDHVARERGRSTIIFIDAVDNLEERGRSMAWLPQRLPATLRIVLSSRPGPVADTLIERGFAMLEVAPLADRSMRESVVTRYLGSYHKRVAASELQRLASAPSAGSPLFLRVVAEEMRLHGEHETIGDVVERYCGARDVDELFALVLDRMERDFGRAHVESVLTLLCAARNGLSEHELLELSGLSRIELSRLLFAFDFHLIRRDALLGFFHDHLRHAVEGRYFARRELLPRRHRQIAEYFATQAYDERRRAEEPWQWMRAGEDDRLRAALRDPALFALLNEPRIRHELIGYWREVGTDPVEAYRDVLERMRRERATSVERLTMIEGVAAFLAASARFTDAEQLLRTAYRYRRLATGANDTSTIDAADELATAIYHAGRFDECEELWREALAAGERVHGSSDHALCSILDSLATCAQRRGDVIEMESHAIRSLEISSQAYGRSHPLSIERLINVAAITLSQGKFDEAIAHYEGAGLVALRAYGDRHPVTAKCRTELGFALTNAGRAQEAVGILEPAAAAIEQLLGEHVALARVLEVLGYAAVVCGDLATSDKAYHRAYRVRTHLQGEDHPDTMFTLSRIAVVLRRSGHAEEAESIIRNLLPRQIAICGQRDENVLNSVFVLITILKTSERHDEAAIWERRYDAADALID